MSITRTPIVDDDGSGHTGTLLDNAWKQEFYDQIDAEFVSQIAAVVATGSWTPTIGGSGGTSGQTYGTRVGRYMKIGPFVIAFYRCVLSVEGTITGNVQIQGLPFTAANVSSLFPINPVRFNSLPTNWVNLIATVVPNSTTAEITGNAAAAGANTTNLTATDIDDNAELTGTLVYQATS